LLNTDNVTISSNAYRECADINQPEPFTESNDNGVFDTRHEVFDDVNGDSAWDTDMGATDAGDVVVYTVENLWVGLAP
jgi:hypothetical protein